MGDDRFDLDDERLQIRRRRPEQSKQSGAQRIEPLVHLELDRLLLVIRRPRRPNLERPQRRLGRPKRRQRLRPPPVIQDLIRDPAS